MSGTSTTTDATTGFVPTTGQEPTTGSDATDAGTATDGQSTGGPVCGDGAVDQGEACDDGNRVSGDGCSQNCTHEECGDARVQDGEACDDGENGDPDDGCTDLCTLPACGDGFVQPSLAEQCDLGAMNSDSGECTRSCQAAACGDGLIYEGVEACDDGASNGPDAPCTAECSLRPCGNGAIDPGEECDDGDVSDADRCSASCQLQEVLEVQVSGGHACARLTGGVIKCWGANSGGQLGLGDKITRGDQPGQMGAALPPVDLGPGEVATALAVAEFHTCALLANGRVKCWGQGGLLGMGDFEHRGDEPDDMGAALPYVDLGANVTATAIDGRRQNTCALLADGRVKCWGSNGYGHLGVGDDDARGNVPGQMGDNLPFVDLGPGITAVDVTIGGQHACALLDGGGVKCWGYNNGGSLGLGDMVARGEEPGDLGALLPLTDLGGPATVISAAVTGFSCAALKGGVVKCWGSNNLYGPLGLGDGKARGGMPGEMGAMLPAVDLGSGQLATSVTTGQFHACALLEEGEVKCWGEGSNDVLGLGDSLARGSQPGQMGDDLPVVDLGTGVSAVAIDADWWETCALLGDGSVKCWGQNIVGELGLGDGISRGGDPGEMGDNLPRVKLFSEEW